MTNLSSPPLVEPDPAYYKSTHNKRDIPLTVVPRPGELSFSPSRELSFALHDVARLLRTYSDQRAREVHMTRAQWAVLTKLRRSEGLKQRELADILDLAPITLARLIDKLTASGLVERREDAKDRRANRLYLTPQATPALKRLDELAEAVLGKALNGLDDQAIANLRIGLERIRSNLKHELKLNCGG
jgi:MarR family transcriptional regulator, transcriptional regulator for hemolysin